MTSAPTDARILEDDSHPSRLRRRIAFTVGCVVCAAMAYWLADLMKLPVAPRRGGALLEQPHWPIAIGVAWLVLIAGSALAAIVASRVHYEGGLFCACIGLTLLSVRMGPTRFALFDSTIGAKIYLLMALELLLLFVAAGIAWAVLRLFTRTGWLPPEPRLNDAETHDPLDQKILALSAQIVVSIILILLLARSDQKAQVLAAVGFASYLAAMAAHHFVTAQPSIWFWSGPLFVGLIGYVLQFISPTDWIIGDARGFFEPLARPMPLDYASLGIAGALLGYWTSGKWQMSQISEEEG
jgi:hypothetical protein